MSGKWSHGQWVPGGGGSTEYATTSTGGGGVLLILLLLHLGMFGDELLSVNPPLAACALSQTGESREQEVGQEVEGHEGDQQPVSLRPGQLGLVQVHRVEDGHDAEDLGRVTDQPVNPVEDAPANI